MISHMAGEGIYQPEYISAHLAASDFADIRGPQPSVADDIASEQTSYWVPMER